MAHYSKSFLAQSAKSDIERIAADDFGIKIEGLSKAQLIEQVLNAQDEAVSVGKPDGPKEVLGKAEVNVSGFVDITPAMEADKVRVIFHKGSGVEDTTHVVGSINGRAFRYPREVEVDVPRIYLKLLSEGAVIREYTLVNERNEQGEVEPVLRESPRRRIAFSTVV